MKTFAIIAAVALCAGKPSALDTALAATPHDPASVSQYRASGSVPCDGLFDFPVSPAYFPACYCYQINAKNALGGYTGLETGVATLVDGHVAIRPRGDLAYNVDDVCQKRGMQKRDPAMIRAAM